MSPNDQTTPEVSNDNKFIETLEAAIVDLLTEQGVYVNSEISRGTVKAIMQDAMQLVPVTSEGAYARAKALSSFVPTATEEIIQDAPAVETPVTHDLSDTELETPQGFDYEKYQEETTNVAIARIYKVLGENADRLVFKKTASNEEVSDVQEDMAQKIIEILIDTKAPYNDHQYISDNFTVMLHTLFNIVAKRKNEIEKEFMARSVGARNPGTDQYSKEYTSFGDLCTALIKVRVEQGNKAEDYCDVVPRTE